MSTNNNISTNHIFSQTVNTNIIFFTASDFNTVFEDHWLENIFMTSTQNWTGESTMTSVMSEPTTTSTPLETTTTAATTLSMIDVDVMCGNGSRVDDLVQVSIDKLTYQKSAKKILWLSSVQTS